MKHQSIPRAAGKSAPWSRLAAAAGLVLLPYSGMAGETPVALANPGFEEGLAGWTAIGNVRPHSALPYQPTEGSSLVAFNDGNTKPGGSLSQSFSVTPGVRHRITFNAGTLAYNAFIQTLSLDVRYGGPTSSSRTWNIGGLGGGRVRWETMSLDFLPTASPAVITFQDFSYHTHGIDLLLDNVTVAAIDTNRELTLKARPLLVAVGLSPADMQGKTQAMAGASGATVVYPDGTPVRVETPAVYAPMPDYRFVRWMLDGKPYDTSPATTVRMDADHELLAVYEIPPVLMEGFEQGLGGWTRTGAVRGITGNAALAAAGSGYVDFNAGNTSTGGSISRTITLPSEGGAVLHLSFRMGIRAFTAATQSLRVIVNDGETRLDHTFHVQKPANSNLGWWPKGLDFSVLSDTFTITFTDVSTATFNVDLLLDEILIGEVEGGAALVQPGTFLMGSPKGEAGRFQEETLHQVTLTRPFLIRKEEVGRGEWDYIREATRYAHPHDVSEGIPGSNPVAGISWWDAVKWCNLMSLFGGFDPVYKMAHSPSQVVLTGTPEVFYDTMADGYRLPTEAEWEYSCRAGTSTAFANGPCTQPTGIDPVLELIGWYRGNSGGGVQPARRKQPNDWGISDMHGNLWEWCWDRYQPYPYTSVTDPPGGATGPYRIARGGGFDEFANGCRAATRWGGPPDYRYAGIGLRIVRNGP